MNRARIKPILSPLQRHCVNWVKSSLQKGEKNSLRDLWDTICIMKVLEREKREKGVQQIITKHLADLVRKKKAHPRSSKNSNDNLQDTHTRHIIISLMERKDTQRILKAAGEATSFKRDPQ